MQTVNALAVRKSLGAVLKKVEKGRQPVLVTRDRKPVAALVPMAIFRQRFVDYLTEDALQQALDDLTKLQSASKGADSLRDLQKLRWGVP